MAFKLKTRTKFPALVRALSPITLVKNGLEFIFGLDISALRQTLDLIYQQIGVTSNPVFYAVDYGVKTDGNVYTAQFQAALDAVKAAGGGRLIIPRGGFYTGPVTYTTTGSPFAAGVQIEGQGQEVSIIRLQGNNAYLFTQDCTNPSSFQSGITFKKFQIVANGTNAGGISIHQAAYANFEDMRILATASGVSCTAAGDPTGSFFLTFNRCRFDNCASTAGCFGLDIYPSGTASEISQVRIENCQFESCGVVGAAVTPPTSGAMRWRGLTCQIVNTAFTTNNNVALYVAKPSAGGASAVGLTINGCDFENTNSTVLPHIYVDAGIRGMSLDNCEFLNNDSFICRGGLWFETTAGVVGNVMVGSSGATRVRATTGNNNYIAFKQSGTAANWMGETCRVRNINYVTFDGTGQTRFSGLWQFDLIPGQCKLTVSALGTVLLAPVGVGNTMPIKLKAAGEWVAYQVPSGGISAAGLTGLTANTQYYFYLSNFSASSAPVVGTILLSATVPTMDASSGYQVSSSQPEILFLGSFISDASGNIATNSIGYSVFPNNAYTGQFPATLTNDNALPGNVGEFVSSLAPNGAATVTMTIATPAVVTWASNPYTGTRNSTAPIVFTTTGALPTGVTAGTTYWVIGSSISGNTFQIATSIANALAGTAVATTGTQSGTHTGTPQTTLTTTTAVSIAAISLPAGDWDLDGIVSFLPANTTSVTAFNGSFSIALNTLDVTPGRVVGPPMGTVVYGGATGVHIAMPHYRFSLSATTTIYLTGYSAFTVAGNVSFGMIRARRAR